MNMLLLPSTAMTSIVYVLFSSLSKACTVFSSPEYFPIEKYFFVSPWREYLQKKKKNVQLHKLWWLWGRWLFLHHSSVDWLTWLGENQGRSLGWWRWPVLAPRPPWLSPRNGFETGLGIRSRRQHRWRLWPWMQVHTGRGPEPPGSERWARGCTHSRAQSPRPVRSITHNITSTQYTN